MEVYLLRKCESLFVVFGELVFFGSLLIETVYLWKILHFYLDPKNLALLTPQALLILHRTGTGTALSLMFEMALLLSLSAWFAPSSCNYHPLHTLCMCKCAFKSSRLCVCIYFQWRPYSYTCICTYLHKIQRRNVVEPEPRAPLPEPKLAEFSLVALSRGVQVMIAYRASLVSAVACYFSQLKIT